MPLWYECSGFQWLSCPLHTELLREKDRGSLLQHDMEIREVTCCMTPFIWNYRKCQLMYSDRKQAKWFAQGWGNEKKRVREREFKGVWGTPDGRFTIQTLLTASQMYMHIKLVKRYSTNICSLLYINYTSIKLLCKTDAKIYLQTMLPLHLIFYWINFT